MLVIQRKKKESFVIGDDIIITIVEVSNDKVKIAIDAPKDIPIVRSELIDAANMNKEVANIKSTNLDTFMELIKIKKKSN